MKTKFPLFAAAFSVVLLAFSDLATATDQVVNDLGDTGGPQQLRAKLSDCLSSGGGTITFSAAGTVFLNPPAGPLPAISGANPISVTVDGGNKIVINGGDATRIFNVSTGATLTLRNLTISHAFANADGGAVASTGTLNVVNTNFFNNATSTSWSGSAILCWGPLTITNSEFGSNSGGGGAVKARSSGAITTITGCKFHDNQSNFDGNGGGGYGGAMQVHDAPSVTVSNCTLTIAPRGPAAPPTV